MENIGQIVREIRAALSETQRQFADRLETSQPMVARWETGQPPGPEWINKLRRAAESAGLDNHAAAIAGLAERDRVRPKIEVRTEEEVEQVNAVLRILRNRQKYSADYKTLKMATDKARKDNALVLAHAQAVLDIRRAIVRLNERGNTPNQIADILGIPEEAVTVQLGLYEMSRLMEQANRWASEGEEGGKK